MSNRERKPSSQASARHSRNEREEADRRVNEAFRKANTPEARRKRANTLPTLEQIELARLLRPQQAMILPLRRTRENILAKRPDHWTVKVTTKLDRLEFPELTQSEIMSEPKKLARLLAALKERRSPKHYEALCQSGIVAANVKKIIMEAVWRQDHQFLIQFGKALQKLSGASTTLACVYRFLLRNADAVEQCRKVAEIRKLPGFPSGYDAPSFYRLCKQVGLPVAK